MKKSLPGKKTAYAFCSLESPFPTAGTKEKSNTYPPLFGNPPGMSKAMCPGDFSLTKPDRTATITDRKGERKMSELMDIIKDPTMDYQQRCIALAKYAENLEDHIVLSDRTKYFQEKQVVTAMGEGASPYLSLIHI